MLTKNWLIGNSKKNIPRKTESSHLSQSHLSPSIYTIQVQPKSGFLVHSKRDIMKSIFFCRIFHTFPIDGPNWSNLSFCKPIQSCLWSFFGISLITWPSYLVYDIYLHYFILLTMSHPKGNQSWMFIGRTDAEAEILIFWPPDAKNWLILKRSWCWERLKAGEEGDDRGWDGWMASLTRQTWVWASSGSWWWTGKPGVLQPMGLQRVRHNWATELNWTMSE